MKKLILLLLVFVSVPTFARSFDIEMIIFKRNVSPTKLMEAWPESANTINNKRAFSLEDKASMSLHGAYLLPRGYYQLDKQYSALEKSSAYTPLVHVAWRQKEKGPASAPVFHIQAGKDYSSQFLPDGRALSDVPAEARTAVKAVDELDGTVQVFVQHYLYLNTDLNLRIPGKNSVLIDNPNLDVTTIDNDEPLSSSDNNSDEAQKPVTEMHDFLNNYLMKQKRQMRSGEIHYLDHPLFGIIIQVRKVQQ